MPGLHAKVWESVSSSNPKQCLYETIQDLLDTAMFELPHADPKKLVLISIIAPGTYNGWAAKSLTRNALSSSSPRSGHSIPRSL